MGREQKLGVVEVEQVENSRVCDCDFFCYVLFCFVLSRCVFVVSGTDA